MNVVLFTLAFIACVTVVYCCGTSGGGGGEPVFETTSRRRRKCKGKRCRGRGRDGDGRGEVARQRLKETGLKETELEDVGSSTWKDRQQCQQKFRSRCIANCEKSGDVAKGLAKCLASHPAAWTVFQQCTKNNEETVDDRMLCADIGVSGDSALPEVEQGLECAAKCFTEDQHGCWEDCDAKPTGKEVKVFKKCHLNSKSKVLKAMAECQKELRG